MGVFQVELEVGDPAGERYETVAALVDSGASYTTLPESLLRELGLEAYETRPFIAADGRRIEREYGETRLKLNGRRSTSPVVFASDDAMPLIGRHYLADIRIGHRYGS